MGERLDYAQHASFSPKGERLDYAQHASLSPKGEGLVYAQHASLSPKGRGWPMRLRVPLTLREKAGLCASGSLSP